MNERLMPLANLGLLLAIGTTAVLGIGCLAIGRTSSPIHRQRLGELTIAATLLWMLLAVIPLPRLLPQSDWSIESETTNSFDAISASAQREFSYESGDDRLNINILWHPSDGKNERVTLLDSTTAWSANSDTKASAIGFDSFATAIPSATDDGGQKLAAGTVPTRRSRMSLALVAYAVGFAVCVGWLLLGHLLLVSIRLRSRVPELWLRELFDTLAGTTKKSRVRLMISPTCRRAMSWGAIWPVIVLPANQCQRKNESQLQMILLHELGHTVQGDAWGNLLLTLAFPLLYAQPLYWWLRSQIRLAAELVADDFAARQTDKDTYALELIALAKSASGVGVLWGATGVVSSPTQFYRRMQMLIARETPLAHRPSATWRFVSMAGTGLSVALAAALFGIQPATGQQLTADQPKAAEEARPQDPGHSPKTDQALPLISELPIVGRLFTNGQPLEKPADPTIVPTHPSDKADLDKLFTSMSSEAIEQEIVIRGVDGNEVEIIIERDGKTSRLNSKKFVLQGGKILIVNAPQLGLTRNDPKAALHPTPGAKTSDSDSRSADKIPGLDKNGNYRVVTTPGRADPNIPPIAAGNVKIEDARVRDRKSADLVEIPIGSDDGPVVGHNLTTNRAVQQKPERWIPAAMTDASTAVSNAGMAKPVDLISLATAFADSLSDIETATDPEAKKRASRKADLLLRIARIEFKGVSNECQRMDQLHATGSVLLHAVTELQSRRDILREILDTATKSEGAKPIGPENKRPDFFDKTGGRQ